jgi:hypothetical protein
MARIELLRLIQDFVDAYIPISMTQLVSYTHRVENEAASF